MNILETLNEIQQRVSALQELFGGTNAVSTTFGRYQRAKAMLKGTTPTGRPKRQMSAAGRARIAAAQKARWAKIKGK